jgi:transcription antitermination factor NusG
MSGKKTNWYVVYSKPRWEKKVYTTLMDNNIEAYCPMNKVRRKWSDRLKWVDEPLFKSYVFVHIREEEQIHVRATSGVVNFVYWLGKPAIVKDKEIELIRKFLDDYTEVQVIPLDLQVNSRITIRRGAFMNKRAKVIRLLNNKVQVIIESIGFTLLAIVDKSNVSLAENKL